MHEPSIRVPLLMECPGFIRPATAITQLATNVDIAPTLLEFAGVPRPESSQGQSLVPLMQGSNSGWRKEFVYAYFWEREAPQTPTIFGLRTDQYSYMTYHGVWDTWELYDIVRDPLERHNLLGETVSGMRYGRFERFIADPATKKLQGDLQARLEAELKRLGGRFDPHWALPVPTKG
jgi:N-acetylglucosamine-6-sulfatase